MAAPSTTITLSDNSVVTMGMRDPGLGAPTYLKVHVSRPVGADQAHGALNAGAMPTADDDGVAIAVQLGLGVLPEADATLLANTLAKVRA